MVFKPHAPAKVRVIRDPRDASLDYYLEADRAKTLYEAGMLAYDVTNSTYSTKSSYRVR